MIGDAAALLDATARAASASLAALAAGDEGQAQRGADRAAGHARRAADTLAAWRQALTIRETADLAEVHPDEVRAAVVTGRLGSITAGPHRRILAADALAFAEAADRRRRTAAQRARKHQRAQEVAP